MTFLHAARRTLHLRTPRGSCDGTAAVALRTNVPSESLVLDLPRGRIETAAPERARVVALPAAWLGDLLEKLPPGADLDVLAAGLAPSIVREARATLLHTDDPTPEETGYALSVAFALHGLGVGHFERWGDALTLVWRDPPAHEPAFQRLAARLAARVIGELSGLDVHGAVVRATGDELQVFFGSQEACAKATELARSGLGLGALFDHFSAEVNA